MRQFTRPTNRFVKKLDRHAAMLKLYTLHYNFHRIHKTLRVTPAMDAGLDDIARNCAWMIGLIDARAPKPEKCGPAKRAGSIRRESQLRH